MCVVVMFDNMVICSCVLFAPFEKNVKIFFLFWPPMDKTDWIMSLAAVRLQSNYHFVLLTPVIMQLLFIIALKALLTQASLRTKHWYTCCSRNLKV